MFVVQIQFMGNWHTCSGTFDHSDDAEWQIAVWRQSHGSNGKDTGFRVVNVKELQS